MRFTHKDMIRYFRVPCGSWLIPTVGSLLCILLLKGISKATGFRFLVWTGIGQCVYFIYGVWHSKIRKDTQASSVSTGMELVGREGSVTEHDSRSQFSMKSVSEIVDSEQ